MSVIHEISKELKIEEEVFRGQVRKAVEKIKFVDIKKKNGGVRKIIIPPWEFKIIQYWVILKYLRNIEIHQSATAFHQGASILKNAQRHKNGNYFIKMDFLNFFPSITKENIQNSLRTFYPMHSDLADEFDDPEFCSAMLYHDRCAIGYPASPYLSNIALSELDNIIEEKLKVSVARYGVFSYTRYADDIVISIKNKGYKKELISLVYKSIATSSLRNIWVNGEKTKYGSRFKGNVVVTGLRICKDGRTTLHRKYKDHVRLMLSLHNKGDLSPEDQGSLAGHLNHCKSSDPTFYNKLHMKYFEVIEGLKK